MKKKSRSDWPYPILVLWLIIVDQLSKYLIISRNPYVDTGLFSLHLVTNSGSSFGLFKGFNFALVWISLIAIGALLYHWDSLSKSKALPVMLILAGIIGNLIDRLHYGFVIDFIDFKFWPVFNIADSCITIGVIWWIVKEWRK